MAYYRRLYPNRHTPAFEDTVKSPKLLLVFLDGVGIGAPDSHRNPCAAVPLQVLQFAAGRDGLPRSGSFRATDATLAVPGIPQSATGQTTLFTGVNAAQEIGRHLPGFPSGKLRALLSEHSLLGRLAAAGKKVTFANVYSPPFFDRPSRFLSVTTVMAQAAGLRLRTLDDLRAGRGLYMDITGTALRQKGWQVPELSYETAADQLVALAGDFDLCLFEFFLTDWIAHRGTFDQAVELAGKLDRFLARLVEGCAAEGLSLVLTSDHGNFEDFSHRGHTTNAVATAAWGDAAECLATVETLADITPAILRFLLPRNG
ncbi:MAG: metalloenzyme [Acidobacteriota bacterium]